MEYLGIIMALLVLTSLGFLFLLYLAGGSKKSSQKKNVSLDPAFITRRWAEIVHLNEMGGASNFKQCILEADKLFDYVLKHRAPGMTMGERLKNAQNRLDLIGQAIE